MSARRKMSSQFDILQTSLTMYLTVPKFLRPTIAPILTAPVSHITSFLILHELTAILPLVSFAAAFHYTNWLPPYITEGAWVQQGMQRFGPYLRRKGWLGEEGSTREGTWALSEGSVKLVVEVATAWAITKALLPVRLIVSVWGTPWFARSFVLPMTGWLGKIFGRGGKKSGAAPAQQPSSASPQVRNDGPLYKGKSAALPSETPKANATPAASTPEPKASGSGAPSSTSPSGVKNEGPLYRQSNGSGA